MRRSRMIRCVVVTVFALVLCTATAAFAAGSSTSSLPGTWSGKYSGAYTGTFKLHWTLTGSKLRGSIALSNPHGSYGITGSVNRGAIKFGTVGAGAVYTGTVFGNTMSGSYKTPGGGGKWSAHKVIVR